ncbi:unnamed protein product [Dracunculus medinensis]|uniref:Succinate--CoA ligase [ADP-forming] subunit beta, mitochondrial n=1 Tax=Dracunculus medinensis TaxID=318479 RepID=A0A0N4U3N7_DRAME|nr:unnamed protein product [Dracunculus medinensis]
MINELDYVTFDLFQNFLQQFRLLSLHEYQSKNLLKKYGCCVQQYILAKSREEGEKLLNFETGSSYVVKAQVLVGGRGKGRFIGGRKDLGGVFFTKDKNAALQAIDEMIGKRLVTKQTDDNGVLVKKVMVAKGIEFSRETYLAILLDQEFNGPVIISSSIGGVGIEELAESNPGCIHKEPVNILNGVTAEQCKRIAANLKFKGKTADLVAVQIQSLYQLFVNTDATQIEINPFAEGLDGSVCCLDAKLTFDDSAAFRQKEIFALVDESFEDKRELEAKRHNLNYVSMEGNIACLVNGAGLAMATMDIIKLYGGSPANFLDVGGSVQEEQVSAAINIFSSDPKIKAILVNIFGGIVNCATIAKGVINACKKISLKVPLIVRLEGTNVDHARDLLNKSNLPIIAAEDLDDAAKIAVNSVS